MKLSRLVTFLLCVTWPFLHAAKPNVILILADDLGWMDTSLTGSTYYQTPNIERLARRGMFFSNAYAASPLCSPTRASILTGQNPARTGITAPTCHLKQEILEPSVQQRARPYEKQRVCVSVSRLKTGYYTLAEALKDVGYATGHFGKWHLGLEPYSPLQHGFDVDIPHWPGPGPAGSFVAPWKFRNFKPRTPNEHIEDRMGDDAVAFMEKHKGTSFFLNYWQFSVHAPFDAKKSLISDYRKRLDPNSLQRSPTYAAMIHSLDDNIGRILDALERLRIAENTIVIFYSDNGGNMYSSVDDTVPTSNAPLRGGKASMYEGGIRVPAIVAWPGVVKGGTRSNAIVQSEDLYPTILEMAGAVSRPGQPVDGLSMTPALRGETALRDAVYCYFPHSPKVPDWLPPSVCVRQGDWKLIRIFHDADGKSHRYELYNLKDDIGERHNLADSMPEKTKSLDTLIDRFLAEAQAVVPQPNPAYDPSAAESISGWKAGYRNTRLSLDPKRNLLQVRAFDEAPTLKVAISDLPPGQYQFEARMESLSAGDASVVCYGPNEGIEPVTTPLIAVRHDGRWHEYKTVLRSEKPIIGLQFSPCSKQGTINIKWIRLRDAAGTVAKEWRFDGKGQKRQNAGRTLHPNPAGWQAGPNGHATFTLRKNGLHIVTTGRDPMLTTTEPIKTTKGEHSLSIRMKAKASGAGLVFARPLNRGFQPGSGTTFPVQHDGEWHRYEVLLKNDQAVAHLRIDPCTGPGTMEIEWIRLKNSKGELVREWKFGLTEK